MLDVVEPVATLDELVAARRQVAAVQVSDAIAAYVVELLETTRRDPRIRLGASTRGGVAMVALARAFAALDGRTYVTAHDVVRAAAPALAHRVAGSSAPVAAGREIADECISQVAAPTV